MYQLIAAGEVVERPSSIVKEMAENSIDAGAKSITIEIKNGGTTYIRITDDGCGIERSEVRKVFVPHATSKIKSASDLDAIGTLGFRGEAMASIAAVSKTELLTRTENEVIGTRIEIAGGEEISFGEAGCPCGTTIVVRDIFFNTPARMKFLKKDVTEGNAVAAVVDRMALSHPEVSFRFIRDGKQTLVTGGSGELKSTVYSVLGKELSNSLISADYSYNSMRLTGFVSLPHESRKSRSMQFFFINGRLVKSQTAMAALEQAYKNSIMVGKFPACVLNIDIDSALVDVNVHPSKTEVRFVNERAVFDLVYYGVKSALEANNSVKSASFTTQGELPKSNSFESRAAEKTYSQRLDFFKKKEEPVQTAFSQNVRVKANEDFWQAAAPKKEYKIDVSVDEQSQSEDISKNTEKENREIHIPDFRVVGEAFKTYIIVEIENELYFIDKHAAHERINYEKLTKSKEIAKQVLLSPQAVNLTKDEFEVITQNIALLSQCGFELSEFGTSAVLIRECPSILSDCNLSDLITEIAQKLLEHKTDIVPEKLEWIYHSSACRAAVKAGDKTTPEETRLFVERLLSMPEIKYCPHGRPVFIKISKYEIEKQFGRV